MRQILIVDSLSDQRFKPFFEKVFFTVRVGTVWKYYEQIDGRAAFEDFQKQLRVSDALFLILCRDLPPPSDPRARFWEEPGIVKDKDVWVFEHCEDLKRISLRIPGLKHYVTFYITNAWMDYVVKIAEGYESDKAASAALPEAQMELLSSAAVGSYFNDATGMALFDYSTSRPTGLKTACSHCAAAYDVHLPSDMKVIRCPACDHFYEIKLPSKPSVPDKA